MTTITKLGNGEDQLLEVYTEICIYILQLGVSVHVDRAVEYVKRRVNIKSSHKQYGIGITPEIAHIPLDVEHILEHFGTDDKIIIWNLLAC